MPVYLSLVVVVLLAVLCPQFGTVAGNRGNRGAVDELDEVNKFSSDQIKMFCNLNRGSEDLLYGFWVVPAEIGNRVMIRFKTV